MTITKRVGGGCRYKPQEFIIQNTVIVQYILHTGDQFPFFLVSDKKNENGGPKPIEQNTKSSTLQCRSHTCCFKTDCAWKWNKLSFKCMSPRQKWNSPNPFSRQRVCRVCHRDHRTLTPIKTTFRVWCVVWCLYSYLVHALLCWAEAQAPRQNF